MPSTFRRFTKKFFIISNILLAAMLVMAAVAPYFHPGRYWIFGVLALGFPILLLLLIVFLIFWLFIKPRLAFISLVAVLIGWKMIRETVGLNFSGNNLTDSSAYKVMSWNVHLFGYNERKRDPKITERMIELVRREKPAIACFQEFSYTLPERSLEYTIDAYSRKLQMPYSFVQSHPLDSVALKKIPWHFSKAIFSIYPIINRHHVFKQAGNYNFSFMYADIAMPAGIVRVFNMHLQSLSFGSSEYEFVEKLGDQEESIEDGSRMILRKIKKGFYKRMEQADTVKKYIQESPYPVIVCGDFNDVPGSYAYLTVKGNLQDVFVKKGLGLGRTFTRVSPTLRIDNIFADDYFKVEGYKRVNKKLSDHFPIITLLKPAAGK